MDHMSRIETLIKDMTLAEKLGQLTMTAAGYAVTGPVIAGDSTDAIRAGTIGNLLNLFGAGHVHELQRLAIEESRLRIPLLIAFDVIHGHRTLFPVPLGEAALFDPDAWALTAREASREAAADGIAMAFAPMLDVSRDPRWGRSAEGPGEDPWLGAQIAKAKVRGIQGADLGAEDALAAVAKHYCAYGAVTAGRDYASVDVSERSLLEVHVPPFAAAIAAGVAALMPAFTDLAGIPLTAHIGLLRGLLRERLGFDGVIVSDYNAIAELMRHGVAANLTEAATLALKAGVDIDMMANAYRLGLPLALECGAVTMTEIDRFSGVKLVLAVPPLVCLLLYLFTRRWGSNLTPAALSEAPVNVLQLVAGLVLLGAGYLLLARSGNQSDIAPSAFELALRSHLSTILQVRPRFKEFVIGFPALMLLPALVPSDRARWGWLFALAIGIGLADVVDTFSHLHTHLSVSLLRLINGAVIGVVVGAIAVVAYRRLRRAEPT